jgi:hypothetical protein
VLGFAFASMAGVQEVLPRPEQPFGGKIERTAKDSTPDFPKGIEAPKRAKRAANYDGRRGFRRADLDADFSAARRQRVSLQHVSHYCALFTDTRRADYVALVVAKEAYEQSGDHWSGGAR